MKTTRPPILLTATRRQILQNIQDGKEVYNGFSGSQLGGAIRSMQMMRGLYGLIMSVDDEVKLTSAGVRALQTGEY